METCDDLLYAMRKNMRFYGFIQKCGLLFEPQIPWKLCLYHELCATKKREGGRADLWVSFDWLNQELFVILNGMKLSVRPLVLE
jgi:hypothetical protein